MKKFEVEEFLAFVCILMKPIKMFSIVCYWDSQVTGSKNEDQVLNAIEAYTEYRPELAHRAINQLFDIARIQHCSQLLRALQV